MSVRDNDLSVGDWANLDSYLMAGDTKVPAGSVDKARRALAGRTEDPAELEEVLEYLGIGREPEVIEDVA